jgi:hypothetical protein
MEEIGVLLNGTLRLTTAEQGMVYPIVNGRLFLSKGVAFKPGDGGRCVELDIDVDTESFTRKVRELAAVSGLFRAEA